MPHDDITLEEIEETYLHAAQIVKLYGDAYLPTFKRLHDELEVRRKMQDIKSIALRVAAYLDQD